MTAQHTVLVASVSILERGSVLLIREDRPGIRNKWNLPSGRIEYGEDILLAAKREVKEETGLDIELTYTTGVYNFISDTQDQVILFHFIGRITEGAVQPQEAEITEWTWIQPTDLDIIDSREMRNPLVMKQLANRLIKEEFWPVAIFQEQLL
ncbi:NUDIX hydrolase [Sporosarcina sp. NCCP-2716]|nr:NUDIX hydrolase [Sporosarcina sp. NCCP-2716]